MWMASSFYQRFAKVCLLCLAFTLAPLWLNANTKKYQLDLNEFVSLIPLWEVPLNSPTDIIGDEGLGYGYYQIHQIMVDDYNRITGHDLAHEDVFDTRVGWAVAHTVLAHYSKHIHSLGQEVKVDHWLFIWNGGGGAWKRVDNPVDDQKQKNLERYRARARIIIHEYLKNKYAKLAIEANTNKNINGKEKGRQPKKRT